MPPRELNPNEFTDRLLPIFEHVWCREAGLRFVPAHFFPQWRRYMETGIARTWTVPGAVLGALFSHNVYSGHPEALVQFWFSLPEVRGTPATGALFKAFEAAARQAGCDEIHSASHALLDPLPREKSYLAHGFHKTETLFTKDI